MTRKDYEILASVISDEMKKILSVNNTWPKELNATIRELTENLAEKLKLDNQNFNKDKFLKACGF